MTITIPRSVVAVVLLLLIGAGAFLVSYRLGDSKGRDVASGDLGRERAASVRAQREAAAAEGQLQQVSRSLRDACAAANELKDPHGRRIPFEHTCDELSGDPLGLTKEICIKLGFAVRGTAYPGGVCPRS